MGGYEAMVVVVVVEGEGERGKRTEGKRNEDGGKIMGSKKKKKLKSMYKTVKKCERWSEKDRKT